MAHICPLADGVRLDIRHTGRWTSFAAARLRYFAWRAGGLVGIGLLLVGVLGCGGWPLVPASNSPDMKIRVNTQEGIFLVYDAALPDDAVRAKAGFLAYWNDYASQRFYLFGRLVFTTTDVGHALLNLKRDLGIDADALAAKDAAMGSSTLDTALADALSALEDGTTWEPASDALAMSIMGFAPDEGLADWEMTPSETRYINVCGIVYKSILPPILPPPPDPLPKEVLMLAVRAACPGGCIGPCCYISCADGTTCTSDVCINAHCRHSATNEGLGCESDENICTRDICSDGACIHVPANEGASCDIDNNICTDGRCDRGVCADFLMGPPVGDGTPCPDDGNPCTDDVCLGTVCDHPPVGSQAPCPDDGKFCTEDYCVGSVCVHPNKTHNSPCPDDGNPCTDDRCYGDECIHPPNDAPCEDDGNPCTDDVCESSQCTHPANSVECEDDGNVCTDDVCSDFICTHPANSAPCYDGDPCTVDDTCSERVCVGTPKDCGDGNVCTDDECIDGTCANPTNNAPCDDEDPCTDNDTCSGGVCAGIAKDCNDDNACTDDDCVDGVCENVPNSDPCDDEDSCTENDVCANGACAGTAFRDCSDGDPCTDDECVDGECQNPLNSDPCTDGNACTENDTCNQGTCSGTPIDCDDGNLCTIEVGCDPESGCVRNLVDCNDGDICTDDQCNPPDGVCMNTVVDCESAEIDCAGTGTPNTGETEIFGQTQSSLVLGLSEEGSIPVLHRIVTHDTGRSRDLYGILMLSLVSGDPTVVDILYLGAPYALGSAIPVVEPGHAGCDEHDWHSGVATFTVIPRNIGEVTLRARVDPDPECCEGDGVPTVEAQVTVTVTVDEPVSLAFAGLGDEDEVDPGGVIFIGAPNPLPALTIDADDSLTGTVEFEVVSGDNLIQMYEDAGGTQVVTQFNQSWAISELPVTRYVEGTTVSVSPNDVEFRLTYDGAGGPGEDRINLTVSMVDLKSLTFTSDHGLMHDNNTDYEPTGELFPEPEWDAELRPMGVPISHTMGANVAVQMSVLLLPASLPATQFTVHGTGPRGFNFNEGHMIIGGYNTLSLTSTDTVEEALKWFAPSINWRFQHNWRLSPIQEASPKLVYVTMGIPRETDYEEHMVTQIRMERAVDYASRAGSFNPHVIVATVRDECGAYSLEAGRDNAWYVPSEGGDCAAIICFVEKVANMVNVPGTFEHVNIYAVDDDDPTTPDIYEPTIGIEVSGDHWGLCEDPRGAHDTEPWDLFEIDDDIGCNCFEAAGKLTACGVTRYYPGGVPQVVFTNKDDVLLTFATLSWTSSADPCLVEETVHTYSDPPDPPGVPACP